MDEAGWFLVELIVIQAAAKLAVEVAWRLYCWKVGWRVRKRENQVRNSG